MLKFITSILYCVSQFTLNKLFNSKQHNTQSVSAGKVIKDSYAFTENPTVHVILKEVSVGQNLVIGTAKHKPILSETRNWELKDKKYWLVRSWLFT